MPTSHANPEEFDVKLVNHYDNEEATSFSAMSWDDKKSVLILLLLYTLQGIPMGLSASIPLIMKERGASYQALSIFSLVSVPFSLKLFWAPLVDSIYISKMGRRKTWLIPVQLLCGGLMLFVSNRIDSWMNVKSEDGHSTPDVYTLTTFFTLLYFLMATQDIAVDGWALTMLSRANVGYASTCNAIGQVLGFFFANQGFIVLSDQKWCQKVLGLSNPLFDLPSFMAFWGVVFIVLTLLVWVFKVEVPLNSDDEPDGILETYRQMYSISRLRNVRIFILVLMTSRIALAPNDSVAMFKMQEYGMPKEDIATLSPLLLVLSLALPAVTSKYLAQQPMKMFLYGLQFKLFTSILVWGVFQLSIVEYASEKSEQNEAGEPGSGPSMGFYAILLAVMSLNELAGNFIFGAQMTFFAKISDPLIGGTYMTLLNTISNLGSKWPNFMSLWLLPKMTIYACMSVASETSSRTALMQGSCMGLEDECQAMGGQCEIKVDGYTVQQFLATAVGILWMFFLGDRALNLERAPTKEWLTTSSDDTSYLVSKKTNKAV
eukprot:CAMPEP_0114452970 /NCGR_PEP_ID=MMETSP0104-20121206/1794_1 /TAXON_ID=37642 ORGANISM="Paraphysomonas imperforata, Strain PA2" /NCGR_SAMPLE_ID=MMETSP0104 /ASSEMBLY_ACC=CAM_ASM_000202 /LENGTH=544 /DNA_ID=CAMNT_0001625247 /DNA_START=82 /DNA_END=1716 /DNA_ORIENTATION=-